MFSKSLSALALLAFSLSLPYQAFGHAIITPAIGVTGTPARSDVTKPSTATPCGSGVNVASVIAGSTAVQAKGDAFTVTVTNFNGGTDGSTEIKSTSIDPTGKGTSFTGGSATITTNGVASPATTGSVSVSGTLPSGTKCTGGNDGASCLVSFTTAGGFGNCVLISQGTGAAVGAVAGAAGNSTGTAGNSTTTAGSTAAAGNGTDTTGSCTGAAGAVAAAANSTTTATGAAAAGTDTLAAGAKVPKHKHQKAKAAGTRLARGLKVRKSLGEELEHKRSWVWAAE